MAENQEDSSNQNMETLCNHCGQVFSAFLHQMEEQNAKVTCPICGKDHEHAASRNSGQTADENTDPAEADKRR
jgi:rubrerythrin